MSYRENEHSIVQIENPNVTELSAQLADNANLMGWELKNKIRKPKPRITFVSDDGAKTDFNWLKPIFDAAGVKGVVAPVVDRVGTTDYMTVADLLTLQNEGWEVTSHTYNHLHLDGLSDADSDFQLRASREWFIAQGLKVDNFCVPYGFWTDREKEIARRYYRAMRTSVDGINTVPIETYQLKTVFICEDTTTDAESGFVRNTLEYYKYQVDKVKNNNGWLIMSLHSWSLDATQKQYLADTIAYIQANGIEICTMSEALDGTGNIVDIGNYDKNNLVSKKHFVIGCDGTISSSNRFEVLPVDSITAITPYESLPSDCVSVVRISSANASGFPSTGAGQLITYKFGTSKGYVTQEFHANQDPSKIYKRVLNTTDGTWGAWQTIGGTSNNLVVLAMNTITNSSDSTTFSSDKITINAISTASATGMPLNTGGTLLTFKFGNDKGFYFQEYHVFNNAKDIYKRTMNSDGTWGSWTLVSTVEKQADNSVTNSSIVNTFTIGKISTCIISTANATGFPENLGGTLITHRLSTSDNAYSFQEYHVYGSFNMYKRYWTGSAWSAWKQISMV